MRVPSCLIKLSSCLIKLSSTLLVASFALTVAAVPVDSAELLVLTPDNFDPTISQGVWFIEHFSPYCGHCRKFLPTWKQLAEEYGSMANPGIHLAQVNCAVHGDLCTQHGVTGYPQMNLYRDGQFVESYMESRAYELLNAYISSKAEPTSAPEPAPPPAVTPDSEQEPLPPAAHALQENAQADREIAREKVAAQNDPNPDGAVLSLTDKTFRQTVEEDHVFVKFFAPWCGHCKKLAPTWTQLAGQMQHKLTIAEVNCEEHNALCRAEGVTGFPMLMYYSGNGGGKTEYTSGRKLAQLKAFADKVSGPAVQQIKYDEFEERVAEHPVFYLLLHPAYGSQSSNDVLEATKVLFGSPPVYVSTSRLFYEDLTLDPDSTALLAFKDHDAAPAAVYNLPSVLATSGEKELLVNWLLRNRLPSSVELDSDNFQEVMNAPHHPLVVLVATPSSQLSGTAARVQKIARQWKDAKGDASVTFAWMDADKWGKWLKSMYGVKADADGEPKVVVADHSRLLYYDVDQAGERIKLTPSSMFSAINGALSGSTCPKHSENMVERMARYLNGKLTDIEWFVTTYPWRTAFFFASGLALVVFIFKRLVFDQESRDYQMRKADRLD